MYCIHVLEDKIYNSSSIRELEAEFYKYHQDSDTKIHKELAYLV